MTILRERKVWRTPRAPKAAISTSGLAPEEHAHVRAALKVLRVRHRTLDTLAAALGAGRASVVRALGPNGRPSAGLRSHATITSSILRL